MERPPSNSMPAFACPENGPGARQPSSKRRGRGRQVVVPFLDRARGLGASGATATCRSQKAAALGGSLVRSCDAGQCRRRRKVRRTVRRESRVVVSCAFVGAPCSVGTAGAADTQAQQQGRGRDALWRWRRGSSAGWDAVWTVRDSRCGGVRCVGRPVRLLQPYWPRISRCVDGVISEWTEARRADPKHWLTR